MPSSDGWMTRDQAAEYLQVSVRHLTRLGLPHTVLGHRPHYSRSVLDDYLRLRTITPGPKAKGGPVRPPPFRSTRGPTDMKKMIAELRELGRQRRRSREGQGL